MSRLDLIALTIWWCEGAKARRDFRWKNAFLYPIEVTNTDSRIIKIFVDFLENRFNISPLNLKGQLQIHDGDDKESLENYWSIKTGIPKNRFDKTIIRKKGKRINKTKGTFKLRYYNKELFLKLNNLLDKVKNIGV